MMFNLRNYLWSNDYETSAYAELSLMVATFGIDEILHSLAEISREQNSWNRRVEHDKEIVTIDGKDYILP